MRGGEKMNIKKFLIGASASAIMLGALAVPAFAAGSGEWNPPAQALDSCNYAHGVFEYFSDPTVHHVPSNGQPPYFGDGVLGSAPGGLTGENNANYSEYCRNL